MIARNNNADLYVSLHINDTKDRSENGANVFVTSRTELSKYKAGMTTLGNKILANLSKLGIKNNGVVNNKLCNDREPKYQYYDKSQADYYADIRCAMKGDSEGLGDNFSDGSGIPTVLIEHCYMNNSHDVRFLDSEADLKKLAKADGDAIIDYLKLRLNKNVVSTITVDKENVSIIQGKKAKITATVAPSTAQNKQVKWTTSNEKIAKVDANGNITAISAGTAKITATSVDNPNVKKVITVNVKKETSNTKEEPTKKVTSVSYRTHVQNVGWQSYVQNGTTSGTSGKSLRLEAINIKLANSEYSGGISYQTHVQNIGWQDYVQNGPISGTSGKSLRLEAIRIKLTGEIANHYDVYYRVHCQNFGWMDWAKNGEEAGSAGYSYRLEGIQICLVKKGGAAPGKTDKPFIQKYLTYQTHVQNIGWQNNVRDKETAGTSGKSLRLEGIKIKLENPKYDGNIEYRTHIQNLGWQKNYVKNGAMSGTTGKGLRLEAIQIRLTGTMAKKYDIYYRVHSQNFGWMGWAKNGASAGTAGYSYRLEAIQICIVEKGSNAPGSTTNCYRKR